jgi:hypothetical protein
MNTEIKPQQGKGGNQHSVALGHTNWIAEYLRREDFKYGDYHILRGSCWGACREMLRTFPELKLVRGHVLRGTRPELSEDPSEDLGLDPGDGHWWLETKEGLIVDPTSEQFPVDKAKLFYKPFDESLANTLPTGKCPNCGGYCYNGKDFCDEDCGKEYTAYLNAGIRGMRV